MPDADIWARVNKGETSDACWIYEGPLNSSGYGTIRRQPAHHWSYEQLVGPVPAGAVLDHLCRDRRCINPRHLAPVAFRENVMRGNSFTAANARKTHCPHGHELDGRRGNGYRYCKTCAATHERNKRALHRAAHPIEKQMQCKNGHPLWGPNCYVDKRGFRKCRTCFNKYMREWRRSS